MAKRFKRKMEEKEYGIADNEIIIGVTTQSDQKQAQKKDSKQENKKSKNNKNTSKSNNSKKTTKNTQNKKQSKGINTNSKTVNNKNTKQKNNKNNKKESKETKKKKRVLIYIKYFIITVLAITAVILIMQSPLFNIKKITVIGNEKISETEILSLSQITTEENTYKVSKNKTINNIKQNPYINDVKIKRKLPSEIQIIVEERKASFQLEYANGFVYINNQGYILEISNQKLELPIIQGQATTVEQYIEGNRLCNKDLEKLSTVLRIMEVSETNEISSLITRIDIENSKNYKIIFEGEGKIAYLGDCSNISTRILNVKAILEKEKDVEGEIFVDMDLNFGYPTFRQKV